MKKGIAEIIEATQAEGKTEDRIKVLHQNDSPTLRTLLKYAFDKETVFDLPPGYPPFKKNEYPGQQGQLYGEMRRMYLFLKGGHPNIKDLKREMLFIQLLETVDPNDAVFLCHVKDKNVHTKWKRVNKSLIEKAFPGLI